MTKLNRGAFRVWDKKNKKYLENNRSVFIGMDGILFRDNNGYLLEVLTPQVCIVEYFTGFYDCNDQPIFEGDMVLFTNVKDYSDYFKASIYKHPTGCWCATGIANNLFGLHRDMRSKIVGTIHDATDK